MGNFPRPEEAFKLFVARLLRASCKLRKKKNSLINIKTIMKAR